MRHIIAVRPRLGYNLASEKTQQLAIDMIQKIQSTAQEQTHASQKVHTVRDLAPLFWEIFQVKQRLDRTRRRDFGEPSPLLPWLCQARLPLRASIRASSPDLPNPRKWIALR